MSSVAGHDEATYGPILDRLGAETTLTLVVLMGVGERARIASRLLARGWERETPAAIVLGASTPGAFAWSGTLAGLRHASLPADRSQPPRHARHRRRRRPPAHLLARRRAALEPRAPAESA